MKSLILIISLLISTQHLLAREVTRCQLSFHSVDRKQNIDTKPYLDHRQVKSIESRLHRPSGKQGVYVTFTEEGARINKAYSEKNIGNYIAIYCDDELLSKPRILGVTEEEVVFTLE